MLFNSINLTLFFAVVNVCKAKAAAKGETSWVRAIEKAAEQVHDNPYISETENGLLVLSATGGEIYHANGKCQCKAYARGMACWHRAAAKLVKRYREAVAAQAASALIRTETSLPPSRQIATV